ncbi:SAM-dependent methyltransferase [Streptomyces sp. NPDC004647]|uniref:SAM-dependent methyltransferase n=1 Tax=Streptomyces sp. NPDC004647 TaxID=3154671 RepID=UPI0033A58815
MPLPPSGISGLPRNWSSFPDTSRVYDALLGGRDSYQADRVLARMLLQEAQWLPTAATINRVYGALTTSYLARRGITQFLDLGCGYPSPSQRRRQPHMPNVHEAVSAIHHTAVVVYVDSHPVVVGHGRARLAGPPGEHSCIQADIRDMEGLLAAPEVQAFDRSRPIAVLLHDVLPYVADDELVDQALKILRAWLPPGSALSITHATSDMSPVEMAAVTALYERARITYRLRSQDHIRDLFADWAHLGPGVVATGRWHADHVHAQRQPQTSGAYAGIAVTPISSNFGRHK